jgi:hypothetical protein
MLYLYEIKIGEKLLCNGIDNDFIYKFGNKSIYSDILNDKDVIRMPNVHFLYFQTGPAKVGGTSS